MLEATIGIAQYAIPMSKVGHALLLLPLGLKQRQPKIEPPQPHLRHPRPPFRPCHHLILRAVAGQRKRCPIPSLLPFTLPPGPGPESIGRSYAAKSDTSNTRTLACLAPPTTRRSAWCREGEAVDGVRVVFLPEHSNRVEFPFDSPAATSHWVGSGVVVECIAEIVHVHRTA